MPGFKFSEHVNAPLPAVFAAFSQVDRAAEKIPGIVRIEMLTPGPIGVGTRFKETRIMFKREATETFEFTAFVPNQMYELSVLSCGAKHRTAFRFVAEGERTRVDVEYDMKGVSFFAKLMTPLASLMMGTIKKCVRADVDALRKSLEQLPVAV